MNIKTITTVDGVNVVDFGSAASRFYWIENLGSTTVYVSGNENIVPDGDNVKVLSAGCGTMVENLGGKVYILGAGKFQITNQGDKFPPFRNAPVADGGVMASGNPVQIDGLQEGVPFSNIVLNGDIVGQDVTLTACGKNLADLSGVDGKTMNGVSFTYDNGNVVLNGTATAQIYLGIKIHLSAGTYTVSGGTDKNARVVLRNKSWLNIADATAGATCTIISDDYYVHIAIAAGTVCDNAVIKPQLERGAVATEYEPYNGSVTTITPDSNPYTVPNDIRQQDGLNVVTASAGTLNVVGVRKNTAIKRIWDEIDEIKTAIIVSNGETIE